MPQILTTNAVILCPHFGKGTSTSTNPKWSVNGGVVLVENDEGVLACPFTPNPCVGYQLRSMGLNSTQIEGRKVMLTTDFNQTRTLLPLTMIETHQMIDNSTPAPIPPGRAAPPLSPELTDLAKPVVSGAPPILAFNSTTMQPVMLSAAFTLVSEYPLKWILTLINESLKSNTDVTDGLVPGLIVTPSGGSWNSSSVTITMTMTATFMASLMPGTHRFFMTGVSQRGLSDFFEIVLIVS